uniref:Ancillary SecYEG translocon subunit n=1 Tax=Candidatus Kentrum sp. UNK TaxID=2126344 RepID=A0A451A6H4_9GAMM|nr:MAG: Putative negative regulator of RcsB-dependent stress response [Candidatus Kentron sp. UNK]VFK70448.1 MAG: Putative negative regulator of RcsB-dependent stress response [Candidatus Kentron sp. UNK]
MRTTYQSEQEQLESLQKWWKENGKAVIFGVLLGVIGIIGWSSWQAYSVRQAEKASLGYEKLVTSMGDNAFEEAIAQGESLVDAFPDAGYGAFASLIAAKAAFERNDSEKAKASLRRVIDQGGFPIIGLVARLRLARLLASEQKWTEALALLDGDAGAFSSLYEEARGDIFLAQGNIDEARSAYGRSLTHGGRLADKMLRERIGVKLSDLGNAPRLAETSDT